MSLGREYLPRYVRPRRRARTRIAPCGRDGSQRCPSRRTPPLTLVRGDKPRMDSISAETRAPCDPFDRSLVQTEERPADILESESIRVNIGGSAGVYFDDPCRNRFISSPRSGCPFRNQNTLALRIDAVADELMQAIGACGSVGQQEQVRQIPGRPFHLDDRCKAHILIPAAAMTHF